MELQAPTDAELLRRFREGKDRAALSVLFERHRGLAYRVALGVLRNPADAEDAAQDAFISLLRYDRPVLSPDSLAGLVARMAVGAAHHLCRGAGRRRARETTWVADEPLCATDPADIVGEREARRLVREWVDALDECYRLPVLLRYFEGLSTREAAQALGLSETAVSTRLSRALARLRERAEQHRELIAAPALLALLQPEPAEAAPAALAARLQELAASTPWAPPASPVVPLAIWSTVKAKLLAAGVVVVASLGGIGTLRRLPPPPLVGAAPRPTGSTPSRATPQRRRAARPKRAPALPAGRAPTRPESPAGSVRHILRATAAVAVPARPRPPAVERKAAAPAVSPAAGGAEAVPVDTELVGRVEQAVAAMKAREEFITSVRGFFTSDSRRHERHIRIEREYEQRRHPEGVHPPADDSPRCVCAGSFVVAQGGRLRLDGITLRSAGWNPWGFRGLKSSLARALDGIAQVDEFTTREQLARLGNLRTVITLDGAVSTHYSEALGHLGTGRQTFREALACQEPLGWILFAGHGRTSVGRWLESSWARRKADAEGTRYQWTARVETIAGIECVRLHAGGRRAETQKPDLGWVARVELTLWLAPQLAFAPVRAEYLMWHPGSKEPGVGAYVWCGEDYKDRGKGVWLPGRVRAQSWWLTAEHGVECAESTLVEFVQLLTNQPVSPDDFTVGGPPLGTTIHRVNEGAETPDAPGRLGAYATATRWQAKPPEMPPDPAIEERLRALAKLPGLGLDAPP